jgi:hypothetical protein
MESSQRIPSFLDAYLVAEDAMGAAPVGVVRKDRNVWRIMQFGLPGDQQPREAFATRREAGVRLLEMARRNRAREN